MANRHPLIPIFFPLEKANEWTQSIKSIVKVNNVNKPLLVSTIGQLNHARYILPQVRYFLNWLQHFLIKCQKIGPQALTPVVKDDLLFWITMLNHASHTRVDIKNITFTKPTLVVVSDVCEHDLGGYDMNGLVWRYRLPPDQIGAFSINLLNLIASAITIHLSLTASTSLQKILAYTNSSSTLGWMYKASFYSSMPVHDEVARWLALELMTYDSALYS